MQTEVVITVNMQGCPEGSFEIQKEFGTPNWFLLKGGATYPVSQEQAGSILALSLGEFESDPELNKKLYAIAETALQGMPGEARVIP